MRRRCYSPKCKVYKHYGSRGITVCDAWRNSYPAYRAWALANGYKPGLSIDRIDNDGNYCPENCRVVTKSANNGRTRRTHFYKGRRVRDIEKELGLGRSVIWSRINDYGWPIDKAMTTPAIPNEEKRFCTIGAHTK